MFKKQQFRADDAQQLSMALDVAMGMKYAYHDIYPRLQNTRLLADPGTAGTLQVWCRVCVSAE